MASPVEKALAGVKNWERRVNELSRQREEASAKLREDQGERDRLLFFAKADNDPEAIAKVNALNRACLDRETEIAKLDELIDKAKAGLADTEKEWAQAAEGELRAGLTRLAKDKLKAATDLQAAIDNLVPAWEAWEASAKALSNAVANDLHDSYAPITILSNSHVVGHVCSRIPAFGRFWVHERRPIPEVEKVQLNRYLEWRRDQG